MFSREKRGREFTGGTYWPQSHPAVTALPSCWEEAPLAALLRKPSHPPTIPGLLSGGASDGAAKLAGRRLGFAAQGWKVSRKLRRR